MKHAWKKDSYFNHTCINCGCVKELSKNQFPPRPTYKHNGQIFFSAPECDGKLIKTSAPDAVQSVLFL